MNIPFHRVGLLLIGGGLSCSCSDSAGSGADPSAETANAGGTSSPSSAAMGGNAAGDGTPSTAASGGQPPAGSPGQAQNGSGGAAPTSGGSSGDSNMPVSAIPSGGSSATTAPGSDKPGDSADDDGQSSIPPGSGPLGLETTCDGVDDDLNGVIDDVDVASDGVCDCLAVATLGLHGEWGNGDVLQGWLSQRSDVAVRALGDAELTEELLAPYHLLVVEDVSAMHNAGLSYSAQECGRSLEMGSRRWRVDDVDRLFGLRGNQQRQQPDL